MSVKPSSVQVGPWRITALLDGTMRLDGGGMWGVVPRTLWRELTAPDDDNTIAIAIRPFLARRGRDVPIPFGPYLAGGGIIALLGGQSILDWYLNTI